MPSYYPNLFSPIKIGETWLKNRIICAPTDLHSEGLGDHQPSEAMMVHLENHAKNGAALIIASGGNVFPVTEKDPETVIDLYKRSSKNALGSMAERVHRYGAKLAMELLQGTGDMDGFGVSEGIRLPSGIIAKEMPVSYMPRVIKGFVDASENLKEAGLDGVFLHFGHGWTIGQFLSPLTNHRTDEFGGSVENRARFPKMIIDAIRERVGKDFLIMVRMSITECEPGGIEPEEAVRLIEILQENADSVNASCGLHNVKWFTTTHPCGFLPHLPNAYLAEYLKKSGRVRIPVSAIGGIGDPEAADRLIMEGKTDMICVARAFIADTQFAKKAEEGRKEDIRPCIQCMHCHDSAVFRHQFRCSVNPVVGMESRLDEEVHPAEVKKKVAVISGGPAGMQAALTAAQRGHEVTLYEKGKTLGGAVAFAKYVDFKYALNEYLCYMTKQLEKASVKILLETAADPEELRRRKYDVILIATGAKVRIPNLPGADKAIPVTEVFGREKELPEEILVIGGGQSGCEAGLHLARRGKKVILLGRKDELAADASPMYRNDLLNHICAEENITCYTGAEVLEVLRDTVRYRKLPGIFRCIRNERDLYGETAGGGALLASMIASEYEDNRNISAPEEESIKTQAVVLAAGMAPDDSWLSYYEAAEEVIPIGNCLKTGTVEDAVHSGFYAAADL